MKNLIRLYNKIFYGILTGVALVTAIAIPPMISLGLLQEVSYIFEPFVLYLFFKSLNMFHEEDKK